ncbi:MAG: hypothetical protein K0U23_08135 [Gammaproteobacteria bacterium]|nr:hypothetical protein [Gammaproteobacteria bacterium]
MEESGATTHAKTTVGGLWGHLFRRFIHVGIISIPLVYYYVVVSVANRYQFNPKIVVWVILVAIWIFEFFRIRYRKVLFAQRQHEATHLSSFGWGMSASCIVLLFAPKAFAYPVLISCAIIDPLLGELRHLLKIPCLVAIIGILATIGIWYLTRAWLPIAWWWPLIMGPITVAAEWPNLKLIDDNAMIQLVPLVVVLLFH